MKKSAKTMNEVSVIAEIVHNAAKGKYQAKLDNKVILSSNSLQYVKDRIDNQDHRKVIEAGITGWVVMDKGHHVTESSAALSVNTAEKFDINERFAFLEELVGMVVEGIHASAIVTGEGGLGKTYTILETLRKHGLKDVNEFETPELQEGEEIVWKNPGDYVIIKGFTTAKYLYRLLFDNRDRLIIFDDCDEALENKTARNILKGALDSYESRWVSWGTEGRPGDDELPMTFKFEGRAIFISNKSQNELNQAIKSRSMRIDLSMTAEQKIDRMNAVLDHVLPEYDMKIKKEALAFLKEKKDVATDLNMRTLLNVIKIRATSKNWKGLAEYTITA